MIIFTRFFLTNSQAVIECFLTSFLHSNLHFCMRKALSALIVATMITPAAFAATGDSPTTTTIKPPVPAVTTTSVAPMAAAEAALPADGLSAAPNDTATVTATAAPAQSMNLGEYKSVACTSNSAFGTNSCDQCFESAPVKVGQRLTGLFDNWTNTTTSILIAYQNEQKSPNMVAFSGTKWSSNPADEAKIWKDGSDIAWVPSAAGSTKKQFMLPAWQKVRFIESDLGAGYTLESSTAKNGELVGLLRFPVVYHTLDTNGNEGVAKTHYECVAYKVSAPVVAPVTPVQPKPVVTPTTPPTKVQTWPETIVLILAAFFIAFGLMFSLRKRV